MNIRTTLMIVGVLGGVAAVGSTSVASTTLPYAQGFESGFSLGDPLTDVGSGTAVAVGGAEKTGAGDQGLRITNKKVTLAVDPVPQYDNVWIQVYIKPAKAGALDPDPTSVTSANASGALYITSTGQLKVFTSSGWGNVGGPTQFSGDLYYGFIIHANYATDTWDLYSTSGAYKSAMTKLVSNLAFSTLATALSSVVVESGNQADIDALAVSRGFTAVGTSDDKVAVYEHAAGATPPLQDFTLAAYASRYTSPADAKSVSGALGNDILSGLVNGDDLYVWNVNDAFAIYRVNSGAFYDPPQSPTAPDENLMYIYSNTRLMIDPANSRPQTFGFYPYVNTTVYAIGGTIQPTAAGQTESFALNGISGPRSGFTALTWPETDTFADLPIKDGPGDSPDRLTQGDRLYVAAPSTPNAYAEYWWNNAANAWYRFNGQPASGSIAPGSSMWVKRQAGIDASVTVTH
ncbi:MAG: hypothetical protein O3B24_07555 [Verrucomicrobia bacterium]|nr:hypothetical protein [Verrucomicrobiota bacterium]